MISVIVATYNQEKTIGRTLDSILMQQCHQPIEIVIGEDCSTDGTLAICQSYAARYPQQIRILANNPNKGMQDNYFDCLLACKGTYIADCAGDDFWIDPLKLEKEVSIMEADEHVTLVHTAWNYYDEEKGKATKAEVPYHFQQKTDGKELLTAIITQTRYPVIHLCTSLYRKDVIMKAYQEDTFLFRNKDFGCEDLQVACAAAHAGTIAYLPDVTLNYSVNHLSVSNTQDEEKQFEFVRKVTSLSHYLADKYHIENKATDRYFSYRIFALAMHAFRAQDKKLRNDVHQYKQQWNAQPTLPFHIVNTITSNDILWKGALLIRKIVLKFKK